jgi:hypothetical protein
VGTGLYGRCDQVANLGHVAHYFFHVGYSPLIPLRSVFVLQRDESVVKLRFSFKAMFFGYFRAFLFWCLGIAGLVATFGFGGATANLPSGPMVLDQTVGYAAIGVAVALIVVLVLSYFVARPSASRKEKLLSQLREAGVQV